MRRFLLLVPLCLCVGCVSAAGRQGAADVKEVLAEVYKDGAAAGDERVRQAGRVQAGVCKQLGAPAGVVGATAEYLSGLADRIEQDILAWEQVKGWLGGLVGAIPYVGGGLAAALAAWKALRASKLGQVATAAVVGINKFKHLAEKYKLAMARDDNDVIWSELDRDTSILLEELKTLGKEGSTAWKELSAIHDALKAKGNVVDCVPAA